MIYLLRKHKRFRWMAMPPTTADGVAFSKFFLQLSVQPIRAIDLGQFTNLTLFASALPRAALAESLSIESISIV
jgi:hypothetical protein